MFFPLWVVLVSKTISNIPIHCLERHSSNDFFLAEASKAAHSCPFPADNIYDFYFPNLQFKSRWEGMNQREIPLLLADDSSVIICIFPNLQNVNILGKNMQTFHISFLMRFLVIPSHPQPPRSESLTSGY